MRQELSCLASVHADRMGLAAARFTDGLVSSVLKLIVIGASFATAATLLVAGIAGGVAVLLDGNTWLANLITGGAAMLLLYGVIVIARGSRRRTRLRRLHHRYREHEDRDRQIDASDLAEASPHAK